MVKIYCWWLLVKKKSSQKKKNITENSTFMCFTHWVDSHIVTDIVTVIYLYCYLIVSEFRNWSGFTLHSNICMSHNQMLDRQINEFHLLIDANHLLLFFFRCHQYHFWTSTKMLLNVPLNSVREFWCSSIHSSLHMIL